MPECKICEREINAHVMARHVRTCRKRPPEEELLHRFHSGETQTNLARRYDVARNTIYRWLVEAGYDSKAPKPPEEKTVRPSGIEIFPMRRKYKPCRTCSRCAMLAYCNELEHTHSPLLCEAPDDVQIEMGSGPESLLFLHY